MADAETAAREMGWRPKEEFRGEPEKWVDAETFVSRGEHFLPIVRADREKLRAQVEAQNAQLAELKATIAASQESLEELKKFSSENTKRQVEQARKELVKQLKEAREAGDVDAETAVLDQLDEVRQAQKAASAPPPPPAPAKPTTPAVAPEQQAWQEANPWFATNPRLRGLALGIAEELRASPKTAGLVGKAFFDKLSEEMQPYTSPEDTPVPKVSGGRPSAGRANGGAAGRSYADLTAEERAACDRQAKKLVGPGRAFKTEADWQAYFVKEIEGASA
jgi:hypothetical protein